MTDEEGKLRDKIISVLNKNFTEDVEVTPIYTREDGLQIELPQELCDMFNDIVTQAVIPYFADALIAAGLDFKENFVFRLDWYDYYQAEQAKRLRAEHRAEVAESALYNMARTAIPQADHNCIGTETDKCQKCYTRFGYEEEAEHELAECLVKEALKQAEKELEGKDE